MKSHVAAVEQPVRIGRIDPEIVIVAPAAVLDVVYHPWPTPLARAAAGAGSAVASGHAMLLHQAAAQVELMTGKPAPVEAMRAALEAELARRMS